jgi:hypothetical protein
MPQRSRKEKIAAQQRKALRYTVTETAPTPETHKIDVKREKIVVTSEDVETKTYFLKDLRKSLIFIVCIFGLEFFLHFVRISSIFVR